MSESRLRSEGVLGGIEIEGLEGSERSVDPVGVTAKVVWPAEFMLALREAAE